MSRLSPDATDLLVCLSGRPPQRAYDLRRQIGWPEDRFARALGQLVHSYPPMIEIYGHVVDQFVARANSEDEDEENEYGM